MRLLSCLMAVLLLGGICGTVAADGQSIEDMGFSKAAAPGAYKGWVTLGTKDDTKTSITLASDPEDAVVFMGTDEKELTDSKVVVEANKLTCEFWVLRTDPASPTKVTITATLDAHSEATRKTTLSHTQRVGWGPPTTQLVGGTRGVTQKTDDGTGANMLIGLRQFKDKQLICGVFNFGGTKTLSGSESTFGAQLLDPSIDSRGVNFRYGRVEGTAGQKGPLWGWYTRGGVSFHDWRGEPTAGESRTAGGQIAYGSAGLQLLSSEGSVTADGTKRPYWFGAEIGPTYRALIGGIASDDELRSAVLGTTDKSFLGYEGRLFVHMGDIQPYLRVSYFPEEIDGFSHVQAVIGIDVVTALFSTSKEEPATKAPAGAPPGSPSPSAVRRQGSL